MKDLNRLDINPPPATAVTPVLTIGLALDPALDLAQILDQTIPPTLETPTRTLETALQHLLPLPD